MWGCCCLGIGLQPTDVLVALCNLGGLLLAHRSARLLLQGLSGQCRPYSSFYSTWNPEPWLNPTSVSVGMQEPPHCFRRAGDVLGGGLTT